MERNVNVAKGAPAPQYNLETAIRNVFAEGCALSRDITAAEWQGLRDELDRMLSLEYPRPVCTGRGIVVDGYATITYNKIENRIVVKT